MLVRPLHRRTPLGVLTGFSVIAATIAVGYLVGRFGIVGDNARQVFSRTALFVTNPALLFTTLAAADLQQLFSTPILVALISAVTVAGLSLLANRLVLHRPLAEATVGATASGYVNANNIGIPVAVYLVGDAAASAPVLLLQLVVFAPVCLTVLDLASGGKPSIGSILTQPVRNPIVLASALGALVAATGLQLPPVVLAPLELLAGAAVPLVLMAFGISLVGARPLRAGEERADILLATALKAVVMPVVAYLVARYGFGEQGRMLLSAVVMAALPTAQNVFLFASRYERGETIARDTILLSTAAAVPVLFTVALLLG